MTCMPWYDSFDDRYMILHDVLPAFEFIWVSTRLKYHIKEQYAPKGHSAICIENGSSKLTR